MLVEKQAVTIPPASPAHATFRALQAARSFYARHRMAPEVRRTFGYFTRHPVAPLNQRRLKMLLEEVNSMRHDSPTPDTPLRILDLACGGGLITCAIASLGHRTLGLDLDLNEIRLAQRFAGEERLDGIFLRVDLVNDPDWEKRVEQILGGKPQIVTLAYALHHIPGVDEFAKRLGRWLSPGAVLIVNEENPESPLFWLKHKIRTLIQRDTNIEWHRSYAGWRAMMNTAGFELTGQPRGADIVPGLGRLAPLRCWSLVFTARKR